MNTAWSVVAQAGFWGWLVTTIGFILTAFPHRGFFRSGTALRWGVPMLLFYALWSVGMFKA